MELIPAVGLIRQSREKDSKLSPDTQRGGITTFAETRGMFVTKWVEELDVPGDAFRPGLEKAVQMVEAGAAQAVVLWKVDRLGREPEGMYSARGRVERAGGVMHFADEAFDLDSEAGDYLFAMFAARAKAERRRIGANWQRATKAANDRGCHQGDAYGYDRVKSQPLALNDHEKRGVLKAFEMRAKKASWKEIGDALSKSGYMPRRASKWNQSSLGHMLSNRVYLGEAKQGDLVKKNAHPRIISNDLFAAVQRVKGSAHAKTEDWLLSGIIRCQVCRSKMRGQKASNGGRSGQYRCRHSRHAYTNAPALDQLVTEEALNRHEILLSSAHAQLDIVALDEAVAQAEASFKDIVVQRAKSAIPELLDEAMQDAEALVVQTRQERENALATYAPEGVGMVFSLRDEWGTMTTPQRNTALKGLIDYVIVHPSEGAAIIWRGASATLGAVPKTGGGQKGDAPKVFPPFPWPLSTEDEMRVALAEDVA